MLFAVCTLLLFISVLTLIVRLYFIGKIPHVTFIFKRFIRPKTPEKDQLTPTGASLRSGAHAVAVPRRPSELRRNLSKKLYTTFYTRLRRGPCSVVRKTGVQQFVVRNHVLATWRASTAGTFRRTYYNRPMAAVLHTTLRSELITPHRPERNPASQPILCSMVQYFVHGTPRQTRNNASH